MTSKYKMNSTNLNDSSINGLNASNLDDSSAAIVHREERRPSRLSIPSIEVRPKNSITGAAPATNNPDALKQSGLGNSHLSNTKKTKSEPHVGDGLSNRDREIMTTKLYMRRSDTVAAMIALVSAIICYAENEDFYDTYYDQYGNVTKAQNVSSTAGNWLRGIIIVLTICLCVLVYLHYTWKLKLLKIRKLRLQEDTIKTSGLFWKMALELLVCAICCPPYFDYTFSGSMLNGTYTYSYDAIISVIMLAKSYLVLRLYAQYSRWTSDKAIRVCLKHKSQADIRFAIKAELKKRPYLMLGIFMTVTVIYLGFAMRTFERSYVPNSGTLPMNFDYLANAFWVTVITMTTVGYGDGYPSTHLGRFIGVIACIIGMLLVSLMVVSLTNASEFTPEESKAFFVLKRIYANDDARDKAANVVKMLFKIRSVTMSKNVKNTVERFIWLTKLRKNIAVFKNDYKVANSYNLPVDEMLKILQSKLENDINDIKKEVVAIPELEKKCDSLKECQTHITTRMQEIAKMQASVTDFLIKMNNMNQKTD